MNFHHRVVFLAMLAIAFPIQVALPRSLTTDNGRLASQIQSKAGKVDYNDAVCNEVKKERSCRKCFAAGGKPMESDVYTVCAVDSDSPNTQAKDLEPMPDFSNEDATLSREQAKQAIDFLYNQLTAEKSAEMRDELEAKEIKIGEHRMRWMEKIFGEAPDTGRSLWISMHGGGTQQVNDQQWFNQIQLYQPEEGIYVAPRAPTDGGDMWHRPHIDQFFSRLIEIMVAFRGVDPNRIYLMGYSAGGDGVWELSPRIADRLAAAAMMAGHPNASKILNLRNLPFAIYVGANDHAYNRAAAVAEKSAEFSLLHKNDPKGYVHRSKIYEGLGHWMDRKDAEALPWMAKFSRNPWPEKIVWHQHHMLHNRFYWLLLPDGVGKEGQIIRAAIDKQKIRLEGDVPQGIKLLLSDELVNLDEPVEIDVVGRGKKTVSPARTLGAIRSSLLHRLDAKSAYTTVVTCP